MSVCDSAARSSSRESSRTSQVTWLPCSKAGSSARTASAHAPDSMASVSGTGGSSGVAGIPSGAGSGSVSTESASASPVSDVVSVSVAEAASVSVSDAVSSALFAGVVTSPSEPMMMAFSVSPSLTKMLVGPSAPPMIPTCCLQAVRDHKSVTASRQSATVFLFITVSSRQRFRNRFPFRLQDSIFPAKTQEFFKIFTKRLTTPGVCTILRVPRSRTKEEYA